MCSDMAIKVEGLSKCFQVYEKPSDRLRQMFSHGRKEYYREFWALKDISFTIGRGETVGIVGRNGSGKSTLLQIICGTLTPTAGRVETNGRVAALLELGSGFNPEFTGRENVFLNASVLGLSTEEIDTRLQDILDFADIGDFVDQPVKVYSSGMMMRLAFAVAINVDPQILIIDEALSVGDEFFQRKCFARIQKIKDKGATILFVSHSGATVVEMCDKAILLNSGEQLLTALPKEVVGKYQRLLHAPVDQQAVVVEKMKAATVASAEAQVPGVVIGEAVNLGANVVAPELSVVGDFDFFDPNLKSKSTLSYPSQGALIEGPIIVDEDGKSLNVLKRGSEYVYKYTVRFEKSAIGVRAGAMLKTVSGLELGGLLSHAPGLGIEHVKEGAVLQFSFNFKCTLLAGTYFFNAGVMESESGGDEFMHRIVDALAFRVVNETGLCSVGIVDFSSVQVSAKTIECE